jgi:hypothetical protein
MNSDGLDAEARKRIEKNLRAMVSYLDKLTGRMHQKMFPADDPLKAAGEAAREKGAGVARRGEAARRKRLSARRDTDLSCRGNRTIKVVSAVSPVKVPPLLRHPPTFLRAFLFALRAQRCHRRRLPVTGPLENGNRLVTTRFNSLLNRGRAHVDTASGGLRPSPRRPNHWAGKSRAVKGRLL